MVLIAKAKGIVGEVIRFSVTGREVPDYGMQQYCTITINCEGTDVTFTNICQNHVEFTVRNN